MGVEKGYTQELTEKIKQEARKVIINQDSLTEMALAAMLSGGHVLIEGVPGLAKTLWIRTMAKIMDIDFKRTQFTSDLMPSDILGTRVFNTKTTEFELKKGPVFTNLFLADEINRTPPKTQSALLEVMEERSISIGGEIIPLQEPFVVLATQNPIEFEGTYPLPEALTDRFMMKLNISYPGVSAEKRILEMVHAGFSNSTMEIAGLEKVCTGSDFLQCKDEIIEVRVDDSIINYIVSLIETIRRVNVVSIGPSPRGTIALLLTAKAYAAMNGRDYVIPDDIKELALPILRHRIILNPESEIEGLKPDKVIENILTQIKVPR